MRSCSSLSLQQRRSKCGRLLRRALHREGVSAAPMLLRCITQYTESSSQVSPFDCLTVVSMVRTRTRTCLSRRIVSSHMTTCCDVESNRVMIMSWQRSSRSTNRALPLIYLLPRHVNPVSLTPSRLPPMPHAAADPRDETIHMVWLVSANYEKCSAFSSLADMETISSID